MKIINDGTFDIGDLITGLTPELEAALLLVILRWATLDGAVSQLFVSLHGLNFVSLHGLNDVESADEVSNKSTSSKLRQLQLRMRPHAPTLARAFGRLKKQYEKYTPIRDTIAHCHCAGHLFSEPERAVFMRYRRIETGLIVDALHIDQFREAARFGEHLTKVVQNLDNRIRAAMPETYS